MPIALWSLMELSDVDVDAQTRWGGGERER